MAISRVKSVVPFLAITVIAFVLVLQLGESANSQGAYKLEGAWVARVVEYNGIPGSYPFQWSYVMVPDASGRSAAIRGSIDIGFPDNPLLPHDFSTPILGEMVQTGPDTAAFDSYWYAIREGVAKEIVYIGRSYGKATFLEPGIAEGEHNFQIFLPDADEDGDGFPEGAPVNEFTIITRDTHAPFPEW